MELSLQSCSICESCMEREAHMCSAAYLSKAEGQGWEFCLARTPAMFLGEHQQLPARWSMGPSKQWEKAQTILAALLESGCTSAPRKALARM